MGAAGFTAVNNRASEPPGQYHYQHQQQQAPPRPSAAGKTGSRHGVGSIRSLLNGGEEGGEAVEEEEEEQGRKLREIEREYGDVVKRAGSASASASASEGGTPVVVGQIEGMAGGGANVVETTA